VSVFREPTPEEVERVRAWDAHEARKRQDESHERKVQIERKEMELRAGLLIGRTIVKVDGDLSYSEWRGIVLHFDDDTVLAIGIDRFTDPVELEVGNYHDVETPNRSGYPPQDRYDKRIGG
jgi:hypothetical protein